VLLKTCLIRKADQFGLSAFNVYYYSTNCHYAHIWSGSAQCLSSIHDRYPAIYVTDHIWKCTADLSRLAQVAILKVRGSFHSVFRKFKNTLNEIFQDLQSTRFTHERSTSNIHRLIHSSISFFEKFSDSLKLGFYIRNSNLVIRNCFCNIAIIIQTF